MKTLDEDEIIANYDAAKEKVFDKMKDELSKEKADKKIIETKFKAEMMKIKQKYDKDMLALTSQLKKGVKKQSNPFLEKAKPEKKSLMSTMKSILRIS